MKLNAPLPSGGEVYIGYEIAPDSGRVVWMADGDTNGVGELYSRAIDGSGSQVKLNDTLVAGGDVASFDIAPGPGFQVVYRADQDTDQVYELYTATPQLHWRVAGSGDWNEADNWTLALAPAGPNPIYIDPAASLTVDGPTTNRTIDSLEIGGGTGIATLDLQMGAALAVTNDVIIQSTGRLTGDGTIAGDIYNAGEIIAENVTVASTLYNHGVISGDGIVSANIWNDSDGTIRAEAGQKLRLMDTSAWPNGGMMEAIGTPFQYAEIEAAGLVVNIESTGLIAAEYATYRFNGGLSNEGSVGVSFGTSRFFGDINNTATGNISILGGSQVTFYDDLNQDGTFIIGKIGSTTGVAVVQGAFTGSGGFIGGGDLYALGDLRPGASPASIMLGGNVFMGPTSIIEIELGGLLAGDEFDQINVTGDLYAGGLVDVVLIDGFNPVAGDSFTIFNYGSIAGSFAYNLAALDPYESWYVDVGTTSTTLFVNGTVIPLPAAAWMGISLFGLLGAGRLRRRFRKASA